MVDTCTFCCGTGEKHGDECPICEGRGLVGDLCENCGEFEGALNSRFLFNNPKSDPDCGDWVCHKCEQELEAEHHEM
jgi:hypothetical protein